MIAVFDTNIVIDALTSILAEQFDRGAGLEKAIRAADCDTQPASWIERRIFYT